MTNIITDEALSVYTLDVPANPVVVSVATIDETPLDWVTGATATYTDPLGVVTALDVIWEPQVDTTPAAVRFSWPSPSLFTVEGLGWLSITLAGLLSVVEGVDPHPVIVETRDRWWTCERVRREWGDAPTDTFYLWRLLSDAREACIEYAPVIDMTKPLRTSILSAQLIQAQNTWAATKAGGSESIGSDGFSIVRHPLDWQVKQLLRPTPAGAPPVT